MSNAPHDILMEALDLMGREVRIFCQSTGPNSSVAIFWGTISGVSEMGKVAHVTVDDFRTEYDSTMRADHMLVEAASIIHIETV